MTSAPSAATDDATILYLARHGQSEWNNQALITGQLDPMLSPRGEQQSAALADCLAGETLAAIYATGLQRTVQTATPVARAKGLPIVQVPELNELHMGVLQGRLRDERDPEAQALWQQWQADVWNFRVPGGERFDEFTDRVTAALAAILQRHRGERILLVGHRATNRVVMGELMRWPRERWAEIRLRNKYFYRIRLGDPPAIDSYVLSGSKTGRLLEGFVM